jgi:phosphatidate cytidylyltransferase
LSPAPDRDVAAAASAPPGELSRRIASSLVLAALAVGAVALGGAPFVLFWALAAGGIFWEWSGIVSPGAVAVRAAGFVALALAAAGSLAGWFGAALLALAAGAVAAAALADPGRRIWCGGGVLYAGTVLLGPAVLRRDDELGLAAILFLFAVVWVTDTFAYFAGRLIGGPKLAPRISPKKTWSGAAGGTLGAVAAGVVVTAVAARGAALAPVAAVALGLSVVSQGGDLFESFVKRRFGVKDAGHLIPGHGGLMDRLDGFLVAAGVAALAGLVRGGPDASARGLLLW